MPQALQFSKLQGYAQWSRHPCNPQLRVEIWWKDKLDPPPLVTCVLRTPSESIQQHWAPPVAHRNCCYFKTYSVSSPCHWLSKEKPLTSKLAFRILLFGRTSNKTGTSKYFLNFGHYLCLCLILCWCQQAEGKIICTAMMKISNWAFLMLYLKLICPGFVFRFLMTRFLQLLAFIR